MTFQGHVFEEYVVGLVSSRIWISSTSNQRVQKQTMESKQILLKKKVLNRRVLLRTIPQKYSQVQYFISRVLKIICELYFYFIFFFWKVYESTREFKLSSRLSSNGSQLYFFSRCIKLFFELLAKTPVFFWEFPKLSIRVQLHPRFSHSVYSPSFVNHRISYRLM